MYAQFFGSFLLSKNAVTPEQLTAAITKMSDTHIKLGTLAMHKGYMTASEVDEVCFLQTREDKRFGEIALERNYLFEDQLDDLLKSQNPDFLLLGQCLVDMGALSNKQLESLMVDYQEENEIVDVSAKSESAEKTQKLIEHYFVIAEKPITDHALMYMQLIFNNLVRFIGEDFTPLSPIPCSEYTTNYCTAQIVTGQIKCTSMIDMQPEVAVAFASRYAKMDFTEFDEYVKASLEDFLNLHNGIFLVNMSNNYSMELTLEPPYHDEDPVLKLSEDSFVIPVIYPFGTIFLLLTI